MGLNIIILYSVLLKLRSYVTPSSVRTLSVSGTFVFLISFSAVTKKKVQTFSDFNVNFSL